MKLDRFYPIFDSVDWLRRTLSLGVRLVQLRIKAADAPRRGDREIGARAARGSSAGDLLARERHANPPDASQADVLAREMAAARDLCRAHGATLIVNDHWRLAIDLGCDFVHLGQDDLETADVSALRRAGLRLGVSTHSYEELDRALSLDPDYVALGPIWPTILKKMSWAPQGLDRVREWKRMVGAVPLCAIGGMTPGRGRAALAAGADLVSVVTAIVLNDSPEDRVREWIAATRKETS